MGKKREKEEDREKTSRLTLEIVPLNHHKSLDFQLEELERRLEMQALRPDSFDQEGAEYIPGCQNDHCDQLCNHCEEWCECKGGFCADLCVAPDCGPGVYCVDLCLADCEFCVGDW